MYPCGEASYAQRFPFSSGLCEQASKAHWCQINLKAMSRKELKFQE
ncbi:hypothetical protein GXM_03188 [Nostoc sphaeroides CCNUC1]|uniref:Uncharacterized protein n=1 Tax=Nostoc sphaeroides CCNUC1 TaxID=2653204 RepID=A0A5P8VZF3_9NOSO|nr:hypothetical protein GXM_03188 [Nostoc sphaeroides CCNUC1]